MLPNCYPLSGLCVRGMVFLATFSSVGLWAAPPADYTLTTFSDGFNDTGVNLSEWTIDPARPHVSVAGGVLTLTTEELAGGGWRSGNLWTEHTQRYGYWEARYTIGEDSGLNNAFWLNTPQDLINEGGNVSGRQTVDRMEVDIQETHYPDELTMNLHDWAPTHIGKGSTKTNVGGNLSTTFHTYGFEWLPNNSMRWYFDGSLVKTHSTSTVNSVRNMIPMETLFSTLVLPGFAGPIGPNLDGTTMDVDWVRVFQKSGWLGGTNGNWGSAPNWGPDGVPDVDDAAIFNGPSSSTTITLATDKSVREVYFRGAETPSFTFAAGNNLHLGAISSASGVGGITLDGDLTTSQTFDVDIVADADLMFGNYSRQVGVELRLNGNLTATSGGTELFFGNFDEQPIVVNGPIGANFDGLTKFKTGALTLAASNDYSGLTDVRNGIVLVLADNALGTHGGNNHTAVNRGATLAFGSGVSYTSPESIHLAGHGAAGTTGALEVSDATEVALAGPVWLDEDATIGSGSLGGTIGIEGNIHDFGGDARSLTVAGNGVVRLSGSANHTGVTKIASGTLALASSASMDSTPLIDVQQGATLDVAATNAGALPLSGGQSLQVDGMVTGDVNAAAGSLMFVNNQNAVIGDVHTSGELQGSGAIHGNLNAGNGAIIRPEIGGIINTSIEASRDVRIRSDAPNANQGDENLLAVGPISSGASFRTLLEFPLDGIPSDAVIVGMPTLLITGSGSDPTSVSTSPTIELYQLAQAFNEGTATWNQAETGEPWPTPGGDLGALLATTSGPDPDTWSAGDSFTLGSEALAADVMSRFGDERYALALKTDTENLGQRSFLWIAAAETASRPGPLLNLSYILTGGGLAGGLTVDGDYTQDSGATLAVDVSAATPGLLVSGTATLDGVIDISLADGFTLNAGDRFAILTAANVNDLGLTLAGDAGDFRLVSTLDQVLLVYGVLPGDYNLDGSVNLADYVTWRDALGQTGNNLAADGTGNDLLGVPDGIVDQYDYLFWQSQFAAGGAMATFDTATAVPEPASWCVGLVGLLSFFLARSIHASPFSKFRFATAC